jgi:glycosyltransferase involved in cell wall biosynthesis
VLSSDYEGLPTVLIEALACGCPVVSTDCPSGPAEILDNGRYGELVPVGDAAALSAAMGRALDAPPPREFLRRRGGDFTLEDGTRRYLDLLLPGRGTSTHE